MYFILSYIDVNTKMNLTDIVYYIHVHVHDIVLETILVYVFGTIKA